MWNLFNQNRRLGMADIDAVTLALDVGNPTHTASEFDKYLLIRAFEELGDGTIN
jgi:hypothetical protein